MDSIRDRAEGLWDVGATPAEIARELNVTAEALAGDPRLRELLGLGASPRRRGPRRSALDLESARAVADRRGPVADIAAAAGVTAVTWRSRARVDLDVAELEAHRRRPRRVKRVDLAAARATIAAGSTSVAAVAAAEGVSHVRWHALAATDPAVAEVDAERLEAKAAKSRARGPDPLKDITPVEEKRLRLLACLDSTTRSDVAASLGISPQRWRKLAAQFPRAKRVDDVVKYGAWDEERLRALDEAMLAFSDPRMIASMVPISPEKLRLARAELPCVAERWRRNWAWTEEYERLRTEWMAGRLKIPAEEKGVDGSWPPKWSWVRRQRAEFLDKEGSGVS